MLPQTNLQLYRQLIDDGWGEEGLARARATYQLALSLFASTCRPNEKPFVSHLVGVAGALSRWGERPAMVLAGLLHSGYFLGDFGDGERGATPRRREYVAATIGSEAEALVYQYTRNKRLKLDELADRDTLTLELADLLDELGDAGPAFSPVKELYRMRGGDASQSEIQEAILLDLARQAVGDSAAEDLERGFAAVRSTTAPRVLITEHSRSYAVPPGVEPLRRNAIARQVVKFQSKLLRKKAA